MLKALSPTSKHETTASTLLSNTTAHDRLLFIILFVGLLTLSPALAFWGLSVGMSVVLGILVAPLAALALIRWPVLGLYCVAITAFVVEQEPLSVPVGTDHLFIFYWPPQLEGLIERPIGFFMLFILFLLVFQRWIKRQPLLEWGALIGPFAAYLFCAFAAVGYGLVTGGSQKIVMVQFRPFWYLFISYILTYNFVTRKSHVRGFFWLAILSALVKGLQGLYVYLIVYQGSLDGHETVMSHEESFFYAALLLLLIIFCMHYRYRPQLIACLLVTPIVLVAMVANQRRTDYIALLLGVGFAWALIFLLKPKARRALMTGMVIFALLGTAYVAIFSHTGGTLGSPARSIIGVFNPSAGDSRDALSNLYRDFEVNDLFSTIKRYPLGLGFGKPFLQPQPLESIYPGILNADPYYNYVPHNTVYWIWVDLGPIGFFALWFLIGSIIVRGCSIARRLKDPYLQVVAIYVVAIAAMEIVAAFADYQLFFYRNIIDLGLLGGLLAKLPILDKEQKEAQNNESIDSLSTPSQSIVGSKYPLLSSPQSIGS